MPSWLLLFIKHVVAVLCYFYFWTTRSLLPLQGSAVILRTHHCLWTWFSWITTFCWQTFTVPLPSPLLYCTQTRYHHTVITYVTAPGHLAVYLGSIETKAWPVVPYHHHTDCYLPPLLLPFTVVQFTTQITYTFVWFPTCVGCSGSVLGLVPHCYVATATIIIGSLLLLIIVIITHLLLQFVTTLTLFVGLPPPYLDSLPPYGPQFYCYCLLRTGSGSFPFTPTTLITAALLRFALYTTHTPHLCPFIYNLLAVHSHFSSPNYKNTTIHLFMLFLQNYIPTTHYFIGSD